MNTDDDPNRMLAEVCELYELALSAGTSLDLHENCRGFITTLMSRQGFSGAAVWLRQRILPQPTPTAATADRLQLVHGVPRIGNLENFLPLDHTPWRRSQETGPFSVRADQAPNVAESRPGKPRVITVFPLQDLGFLQLVSVHRTDPLDAKEMSQLTPVIQKFAVSIAGCIGHAQVTIDHQERESIQAQLRQSQKMEAIGLLAGGIAHDFNNLLAAMIGNTELLLLQESADSPRHKNLTTTLTAAKHAAELTRQLLAFSRNTQSNSAPIVLDELIEELVSLLNRTVGPGINIETELKLGSIKIQGDASQLQSAFLNLGVNARDAMPAGGILRITTDTTPAPAVAPITGLAEAGTNWVKITVEDTGEGMSPETMERIFEPFFTTKENDKGTGLGLASTYGIINVHNGLIQVSSSPGNGTKFTILLPGITPTPLVPTALPPPPPVAPVAKPQQILLVDDDETVRKTSARLLKYLGYSVLEAASGQQGVELARESHENLAAVLLDLRMPDINGDEVLRQIREFAPRLPVIVASGYAEAPIVEKLSSMNVTKVLTKPFSLSELSEALAEAVDAS